MLRFIVRRLGLMALVLFGLAAIVFLMAQVVPGDPARTAAGRNATAEQVAQARERLGLDEPLLVQFGRHLSRLAHGDLGTSLFTSRPITADLADVLPASVELVLAAMLVNLLVAVPLGVISAARRGRAADLAARLIVMFGAAVPVFWLGLMLQYLLAAQWQVFPLTGRLSFGVSVPERTGMVTVDALLAGDLGAFSDALAHLVLPAVTLAAPFVAVVARTLRSTMISALDRDFVTLAECPYSDDASIKEDCKSLNG